MILLGVAAGGRGYWGLDGRLGTARKHYSRRISARSRSSDCSQELFDGAGRRDT